MRRMEKENPLPIPIILCPRWLSKPKTPSLIRLPSLTNREYPHDLVQDENKQRADIKRIEKRERKKEREKKIKRNCQHQCPNPISI